MITYPRTPQRDCLNHPQSRLLMVRLDGQESIKALSTDGAILSFQAAYIHSETKRVINHVLINLHGPSTVYFVRSYKYAGWAYIAQWSQKARRYTCTCSESRSQSWCQHVNDLPASTLSELA